MKKYMCIGNDTIKSQWLPKWYNVSYKECLFDSQNYNYSDIKLIELRPIMPVQPYQNEAYEAQLKILKTEHLLTGG